MSPRIARMIVGSFHISTVSPLSSREKEVLQLMSEGMTYRQSADKLCIGPETVRTHIKNIYQKLDVHNRADAIRKARKNRLI